jgi:mRNA interferase HigB
VKVLGRPAIQDFGSRHKDAKGALAAWLLEAEEATWRTPQDIKNRYAHASFLHGNRVVFNIRGNSYRLDAKIDYKNQIVLIKRIGTHKEYDAWEF